MVFLLALMVFVIAWLIAIVILLVKGWYKRLLLNLVSCLVISVIIYIAPPVEGWDRFIALIIGLSVTAIWGLILMIYSILMKKKNVNEEIVG